MDVNFTLQPPLPVATGASANPATGGEVKTVQQNPASVVTSATSAGSNEADRRRDTHGRQADERVSAQKTLESLRLSSRRTQISLNAEFNRVFLQVVDTRTDEVVDSIPSEALVRQLKEHAASSGPNPSVGTSGAMIDEQV